MKRIKTTLMENTDWGLAFRGTLRGVTCVLILTVILVIVTGIKRSEESHAWVEVINQERTINRYGYPTHGYIDYDLEARVPGKGGWSCGALAANFGDSIEFRLRIAAEDLDAVDVDKIAIIPTSGLANTAQNQIDSVDGHIQYIPLGVYEFNAADWRAGAPVSSFKVMYDDDIVDQLDILPPYNEVDLPFLKSLIIMVLVCGVAIPLIVRVLSYYRPWRYLVLKA